MRFLLLAILISVAAAEPVTLPTLRTIDGREFSTVTVTEKRPDGISIRHATGTARIAFEVLPGLIKKQLGGFDSDEAKKSREADAAALAEAEAALDRQFARIQKNPSAVGTGERIAVDAARAPVANADKLFVKPDHYSGLRLEITGRAGARPLTIIWGSGSMKVAPWTTEVARPVWSGDGYRVRAVEDGVTVDTETSRQKTGLGADYKLR